MPGLGRFLPPTLLVAGRDALAAAILRSGGLLRFGQRFMGDVRVAEGAGDDRPRTLFEKIIARHALSTPVTNAAPAPGEGAFVRADLRFIHEYYTGGFCRNKGMRLSEASWSSAPQRASE